MLRAALRSRSAVKPQCGQGCTCCAVAKGTRLGLCFCQLPLRRLGLSRGGRLCAQHLTDVLSVLQILELVRDELSDFSIDPADGVVNHPDRTVLPFAQLQLVIS